MEQEPGRDVSSLSCDVPVKIPHLPQSDHVNVFESIKTTRLSGQGPEI